MWGMSGTGRILLAALSVCVGLQPAASESRLGTLPLVISATGSARTPADKITIFATANETADTTAAARARVAEKIARLRSALAAAGLPATAIKEFGAPFGFIGNAADDEDEGPKLPSKGHMASSLLQVVVDNPGAYSAVRKTIADQGLALTMPASFELKDDRAAHAAAVADAIKKARAEAALYASELGYRVAMITEVKNTIPPGPPIEAMSNIIDMMRASQAGEAHDVVTEAQVTISFVVQMK